MNGVQVYLQRKFRQIQRSGCDIEKMHEYFCIPNTPTDRRTIILVRDEEDNMKMHLTIKRTIRECTPFESYIKQLPRDVNNYIYEFLADNRCIQYTLTFPPYYPFNEVTWKLESYIVNRKNTRYTGFDPNTMYCGGDQSPCMLFETEILLYVSKLDWFIL